MLLESLARRTGWVLLGCALAVLGAGCSQDPRSVPGPPSGELPDQEVSDFVVTETDEGNPQWTLYARSAEIYNPRNTIIAHAVRIDFFNEKGERTSTLTAREGEMNQQKRDMVARGSVVIQTAEGTRMSTEELKFLNQRQRVVSDKLVRVEHDGTVLTGIGFESDPNLEHYEFKHQIQATVRTRSGGVLDESRGKR